MNISDLISAKVEYQILASLLFCFVYFILRKVVTRVISKRALLHNFDDTRALYIQKSISILISLLLLLLLGIVWEISLEGLSVYIASFITIIGVGLFATWSMVSNITASVILFFFFPFKIGSKVKIVDGDNSAIGVVMGISLFSIRIQCDDGTEIFYPNNIAIQKAIVHLNDD